MTAKIIGDPFAPRAEQGQPDITIELTCGRCGKLTQVVMTWESARQFAARLNHEIASTMRDLPRIDGPFLGPRA